jgi:two-component system, chemotaxis family, CheB/CheR fusion protein
MQTVGADGYLGYLDHLEVDPEEFTHLFNTILINVTGFFRDLPAWEYLGAEILPRLAADKRDGEPIRVWSAGCASGEEAYTLAMAIAETLGPETVKERVKIYATDLDEDALNQGRQARYTAKQVEGVPPELLERYFERNGHGYVFSKELRRSVIFGRHDLIQDAPISRIDLLVCHNTLMYLNSDTQAHVLARFNFALREGGYLFLGKAEMLLAHSALDQVRPALWASMSGDDGTQTVMVEATNRRGKPIDVRVTCSPLVGDHKDVHGVIMVVEERPDGEPAEQRG